MNKMFLSLTVGLAIGLISQAPAMAATVNRTVPRGASRGRLFKAKVSLNLTRADKLMAQNKFEDAEAIYRHEISRDSRNVESSAGLGMALSGQFKLDAADEQFDKTLALDPNNAVSHMGKALVKLNRLQSSSQTVIKNRDGMLRTAEGEAKLALASDPTSPQAHYALGMVYKEQQRLADARNEFQAAIEADPDYASAHTGLGMVALAEGRDADSVASFRKSIEINSTNSTAHYGLGEALLKQGMLDESIKELNISLYQFRNSAPVHLALGKAYEGQGNIDAALKEYERAALIKPELKEAYTHMAMLHVQQGRQFQNSANVVSALKEYRQAELIEPLNPEPYLRMADLHEWRGDLEMAASDLRSGAELNPTDTVLHQRIGDTMMKLDRYDDAIKEFRAVLQTQPASTASVDGLTRAFYLKSQKQSQGSFLYSNDYETAEATLQQAIRLRPQDMQLQLALAKLRALAGKPVDLSKVGAPTTDPQRIAYAEALLAQNRFGDAQQEMAKVIDHTTDPGQLFAVADLSLMIKDLSSAETAYKKAEAGGNNDRAARGLAAIAKVRDESTRDYRLANDLLKRNQLASAVDNFRQASFNDPRSAGAHFGLAEAERRLSPDVSPALRDASAQYRAYLALAPNLPQKARAKISKRADKLDARAAKIDRKNVAQLPPNATH